MILFFIVLFIIGCSKEPQNYFPLAVGYEWDYRQIINTIIQQDIRSDTLSLFSWRISGDTTLDNGTPVFIVDLSLLPVYYEETEGYILQYTDLDDTIPDTIMALPLENGKTWRVDSDKTAEVTTLENISVIAGTYQDCWKVMFISNNDTLFKYYAPDIGLIKQYEAEVSGDTIFEYTFELVDMFF